MAKAAIEQVMAKFIPASVEDYRALARARLPGFLFDYIDGGSYAEATLARNTADLQAIALRQRVLRDVSRIELKSRLLGVDCAMPVALAPVGLAGMYARRGEVQAARAAATAGVPFTLSTVGVCAIEEAAPAAKPFWFQLYMLRDRGVIEELLARAQAAGASALLLTVDLPVAGARYRDVRRGFAGSGGPPLGDVFARPGWLWNVGLRGRPHRLGNVDRIVGKRAKLADFWRWVAQNFDPSLTWNDVEWIRQRWKGPMAIKGVLDPDDARAALACGAEGVVVSNHGGRQLDGVLSGAAALPPIADAVGDRMEVLMDGGVRSGLDVVRALALGARGVLIGRPWAWALAARGGRGVGEVLDILRREMLVAMALTGCVTPGEVDRSVLASPLRPLP